MPQIPPICFPTLGFWLLETGSVVGSVQEPLLTADPQIDKNEELKLEDIPLLDKKSKVEYRTNLFEDIIKKKNKTKYSSWDV